MCLEKHFREAETSYSTPKGSLSAVPQSARSGPRQHGRGDAQRAFAALPHNVALDPLVNLRCCWRVLSGRCRQLGGYQTVLEVLLRIFDYVLDF